MHRRPSFTGADAAVKRDRDGGDCPHYGRRDAARDLLGIAWVLGACAALVYPALHHGPLLGPYDLLRTAGHGLTTRPGAVVRVPDNSDVIDQMIPWTMVAWGQVHAGHLPLWNPFGGLGTPLAFNWQSAAFAFSTLVAYLAPLRMAFTVSVLTSLGIAGAGAYVLGRVLGLGVTGSATVGTIFALSGPSAAWLGYPFAAVNCWAGWLLAFGILAVRGRRPMLAIAGVAAATACVLYGGQPEGAALLLGSVAVFFVVVLLARAAWLGGSGPIRDPGVRVVAGVVAGVGLALPLLLPALAVTQRSIRAVAPGTQAFPAHQLAYLLFQGYDGLPLAGNGGYGASVFFYTETAAYVGVSALVLAGLGVVVRRRRTEVWAFAAVVGVCLVLVFVGPVDRALDRLPLAGSVTWWRALMPLALAVAALAGLAVDAVVRQADLRRSARWLGVAFGAGSMVVAALWLFGRGGLHGSVLATRDDSFRWQVVCLAVGLVAALGLWFAGRSRRAARSAAAASVTVGLALAVSVTAFLVGAGAPLVQSSSAGFPEAPAMHALKAAVGSATVGFGPGGCTLGIEPNVNDAYGVHELAVYDASLPADYFTAWPRMTGTSPGIAAFYTFCPVIASTVVAKEFGVGFLLERTGVPGPAGTAFVRRVGDEALWRVSGSGQATVTPLAHGHLPPVSADGRPVPVDHPSPRTWQISVATPRSSLLRLHLTDVPGWHATIDGRPLSLLSDGGMMLEARIPPGRHSVVLTYWPVGITEGLVAAGACLVGLVVAVVVEQLRRRSSAA